MTTILPNSLIGYRNDEYDYSSSKVVGKKHKYLENIKCLACDAVFKQLLLSHLRGSGCKCKTTVGYGSFVHKAIKIHGNKYVYNESEYINQTTKIRIICDCGNEFYQTPHKHLLGQGCPVCAKAKMGKKLSLEQFIEKAIAKHGNRFDYTQVEYNGYDIPIKIRCLKCNSDLTQTPDSHLHSNGCFTCSMKDIGDLYRSSKSEFVEKSINIHGNRYSYDRVDYINNTSKVIIKCNSCNQYFTQVPTSHLSGNGCRCISSSLAQEKIARLIDIDYILNDRNTISPLELDILVPSKNLAIEYNGIYWHSYNKPETIKEIYKHYSKHDICILKGIKLLQFFENQWIEKEEIVQNIININIGKAHKLYARNCKIRIVPHSDAKEFFDSTHLYGNRFAKLTIGLYHDDKLVSAMSFTKYNNYWEIIRYSTALNLIVVGGASKIFKEFIKIAHPTKTITYADRMISTGNIYRKLGFTQIGVTKPNYYYVKGNAVYSRHKFQKHKLIKMLKNYNDQLSESQNMFNNNYRRIWDAGHYRFQFMH